MAEMIRIPIPEPLARIYESAPDEARRKAQWMIELVLRDLFETPTESLSDVVRDISQQAAERGLTPEILDDLLD